MPLYSICTTNQISSCNPQPVFTLNAPNLPSDVSCINKRPPPLRMSRLIDDLTVTPTGVIRLRHMLHVSEGSIKTRGCGANGFHVCVLDFRKERQRGKRRPQRCSRSHVQVGAPLMFRRLLALMFLLVGFCLGSHSEPQVPTGSQSVLTW